MIITHNGENCRYGGKPNKTNHVFVKPEYGR